VTAAADALERVRAVALALPDASERPAHGCPSFYVGGKRQFAMFHDNHHGDGRVAIWCPAPEGLQEALVSGEPEHYFRPPYVGHRGWIGVRLDTGLAWDNVAAALEDAYDLAAAKR
jgi:hypothetical protein